MSSYQRFEILFVRGLFAFFIPILLSLPVVSLYQLWSYFPWYVLIPVGFLFLFITMTFIVFVGTMVASLSIRA